MPISNRMTEFLVNVVEAAIKQALPDVYSYVVEKIYRNPHVLNVNLVLSEGKDHFRFVNLSPLAIYVKSIEFTMDGKKIGALDHILHPSTSQDPYGEKVINRISFKPNPVFLYPRGIYYLPIEEITQDIQIDVDTIKRKLDRFHVDFRYITQEGKERKAENLPISVVEITRLDKGDRGPS